MTALTEDALIRGAKQFNPQALAEIYDRYSSGLFTYAMRLLGDECLAEDCVADTFSRFLKGLRAGNGPDRFLQAYLYRIAHNWVTDFYRRQPPPTVELEDEMRSENAGPETEVDLLLQQKQVRWALRLLTPDQRQVIVLRYIEGWGSEQIAAAVQKPVSAVKALQHRALESLRRCLLALEKEEQNVYKLTN